MENCPGPEKCRNGGFIFHASSDPLYSDECSRCPRFDVYDRISRQMEKLKKILPKGLLSRTLESFVAKTPETQKALGLANRYVQEKAWRDGSCLVILGGYGTGKTHLAAGIAMKAAEIGETVAFVTAPSLKLGSFSELDEKVIELCGKDLLVIDDFSNETENRTTNNRLFELINHRYEQEKGTIITSNLEIGDFSETVGARIFERLCERAIIMSMLDTQSYRENKRPQYVSWARTKLPEK